MSFQAKVIAATGVIVILALAFLFFWPDPDAAELEQWIEELIREAQAGNIDACMERVHLDYNAKGETYEDVRRRAARYLKREEYRNFQVNDLHCEVTGKDGRVHFEVSIKVNFQGREWKRSTPVVLFLRKFEGAWKIVGYEISERGL